MIKLSILYHFTCFRKHITSWALIYNCSNTLIKNNTLKLDLPAALGYIMSGRKGQRR